MWVSVVQLRQWWFFFTKLPFLAVFMILFFGNNNKINKFNNISFFIP